MTLEISLRPPLSLPHFLQAQKDEPRRDIHWIGQKKGNESQPASSEPNPPSPKPDNSQGYRSLASIKLGEVDDAQKYFANQLLPVPYPSWIGKNHFCNLSLVRKRDGRPPMIFGRVKTCFPSDGYINNIQIIELQFPNKERQPDSISLNIEDILQSPQGIIQSYSVRVKFLASPEDEADFQSFENLFASSGLTVEFTNDYLELLHLEEFNKDNYPWFYVISSRWFASIPVSIQEDIRQNMRSLIRWNKHIFNYHPKWLPPEIHTLNQELDFNYGFSDHYLIAPETPQQTAHIVTVSLDKLFTQPMK